VLKVLLSNSGGYNATIADMIVPASSHSTGIDRNSGAKVCLTYLRANEAVAQQAEAGVYGAHPLSVMAHQLNQEFASGSPSSIKFKLGLTGEGSGWIVTVIK